MVSCCFRNRQHDKTEKEFVCQKLKLLAQTEFREKLDKHLYQMVGMICMMFMQLSCTFGCICWDLNNFIAPLTCDYDIQDSLSLLGDIVGSCVRPSAPEQDVWKVMIDKMIQLKKDTQEDN